MKKCKYEKLCAEKLCAERRHTFLPFAMETLGAMGPGAREMLWRIYTIASRSESSFSPEEIRCGMRDSLAVALQVGNARTVMDGFKRLCKGWMDGGLEEV